MRRLSTFSALKHTTPWKNLVTRSVAVSSPVNNPGKTKQYFFIVIVVVINDDH